jgi:hypothetical protein
VGGGSGRWWSKRAGGAKASKTALGRGSLAVISSNGQNVVEDVASLVVLGCGRRGLGEVRAC